MKTLTQLIHEIPEEFNPTVGMNRFEWFLEPDTRLDVVFQYDYDVVSNHDEDGYTSPYLSIVNEKLTNIEATILVEGDEIEISPTIYTLIEDVIKERVL